LGDEQGFQWIDEQEQASDYSKVDVDSVDLLEYAVE
jgi:hypothetical protein